MIKEFNTLPEDGGLMDQGHLFLLEYQVIDQVEKLFEVLDSQAEGK